MPGQKRAMIQEKNRCFIYDACRGVYTKGQSNGINGTDLDGCCGLGIPLAHNFESYRR